MPSSKLPRTPTLLISRCAERTTTALVENRQLVALRVEGPARGCQVGEIYIGKVIRVLPGLDAAFVDIGLDKPAFLAASEVAAGLLGQLMPTPRAGHASIPSSGLETQKSTRPSKRAHATIGQLVRTGQSVLVQVRRVAGGTKGARVTTQLHLSGRLVVLSPWSHHVAVSQKITDTAERERLTEALLAWATEHAALVVRTGGQNQPVEALLSEAQALWKSWRQVADAAQTSGRPRLLSQEAVALPRAIKELWRSEVAHVLADDAELARDLEDYVGEHMPSRKSSVVYAAPEPVVPGLAERRGLLARYGLTDAITAAFSRRAPLPSGGFLLIDPLETLCVIDVNSGRFVGTGSQEESMLALNCEAALEVARQLRLRNIGGIIVVDFIDLSTPAARHQVVSVLREALAREPTVTVVLPMSELGLVQLTRRRTGPSLSESGLVPCKPCRGMGLQPHPEDMVRPVLEAVHAAWTQQPCAQVLLNVAPEVADVLFSTALPNVKALEEQLGTSILPISNEGRAIGTFEALNSGLPGLIAAYDVRPKMT